MTLALRQATDRDLPRIKAIVDAAYSPYIPLIGRPPAPMRADYAALIAAGQVWLPQETPAQALAVLIAQPDYMLLDNIAVDPAAQGRGQGQKLLAAAEALARRKGFSEMRLYTNAAMERNLRIYRKAGYEETRRAFDEGFHRVHMSKRL